MLTDYVINPVLVQDFNNVIGFLNDTRAKFPAAVFFAAGMPDEHCFEVEAHFSDVDYFIDFLNTDHRQRRATFDQIGQYASCKGIVNDLIALYLKNDENINVARNQVIVTTGAQEAFAIIVATLCRKQEDVVLVEAPSYMGLSSFCEVFGYAVEAVPTQHEGLDLTALEEKILAVRERGKQVKLLYVIPDFQNPTGYCLPVEKRKRLLQLATRYNFLIVEDAVYAAFSYSERPLPSLKSMDREQRVIYVASFAKSLFPGLRIGLLVADQRIQHPDGTITPLIDELEKVKGIVTNNTSTVSQSVLGGILVKYNCSLKKYNEQKIARYKSKYEAVIRSLHQYFPADEAWTRNIRWNTPGGGFFIKMSLPFRMGYQEVFECAEQFRVIVCPMSNFYLNGGGETEIRLAFSSTTIEQIDEGIRNLAAYLKHKTESRSEIANALLTNS